ncbi:hypothetical protein GH714_025489 [Hevea brasiliensis]|uniref:Suppressor of forked domain-containing protein n=1 Tax=Hevea brasiliensis TaxID=3981 RepID=A0A6A6MYT5_HEVBR|nr:hypothetical protein GH714_025489 [Hevea brasiliensis]
MKDLVMKKRSELEEICRKMHTIPEVDTVIDYAMEAIKSENVDPAIFLEQIELHIGMVEALASKTIAWEKERGIEFFFDGTVMTPAPQPVSYDASPVEEVPEQIEMDVPRYKPYNHTKLSAMDFHGLYRFNRRSTMFDRDDDIDALDVKLKSNGRYWSGKYAALEFQKNLKRLRLVAPKQHVLDGSDDYIPFSDTKLSQEGVDRGSISKASLVEESWEDEVLRKSREFNQLTRENPHDEKVWLDFAEFQDRVAKMQPQKGARLQMLEKKISILEKAVELNPDNEELLLCLLKAYQSRDSTDMLIGRWEKVYQNAKASSLDPAIVQLELGLVDVFLSLCRFEWQAGYQELATALFQAEIEFSLFCPSLLLSEHSKLRLFEHFWNGNGPRVGEEGAVGWSSWLEKEEETRQKTLKEEETLHDDERGGWTGWSEPLPKFTETDKSPANATDDNVASEELQDEFENEEIKQEDDTEALLKQLGIDVDTGPNSDIKNTSTWIRWICTNSSSCTEKILSMEVLPNSIVRNLSLTGNGLVFLLGNTSDHSKQTDVMKFLRNAILLCFTAFPRNHILEEAALVAEELSVTRMDSSTPCRALAKYLLKSDRQDLLLCGVYAQREAASGNIDHARRVFDMALSSIDGLPLHLQSNAPLLYFWYAEAELANSYGNTQESSPRALHILSCLGTGPKYYPFEHKPSGLQLLRAHQGFKEKMRTVQSAWVRGVVDDQSIALICSAALFEELTTGWAAGIGVVDEALTMVLPVISISMYDCFLNLYVHVLINLDDYAFDVLRKPSVIVWIFALSFEMSRGGSHHRIHGLFERALANESLRKSVILWRTYIAYEIDIACNPSAARRIFFRAIHACPWSKKLWLDGFLKLNSVLSAKELSDLQEVMRDKELNLRTDIYEILLQDELVS